MKKVMTGKLSDLNRIMSNLKLIGLENITVLGYMELVKDVKTN